MRKVMEGFGGVAIAAAAVLIVLQIYAMHNGTGVLWLLKRDASRQEKEYSAYTDRNAMNEAVSHSPVFDSAVARPILTKEQYLICADIRVTDEKDGYEKTLEEAVKEGRIRDLEISVTDEEGKELDEKDITIDKNERKISLRKSGVYKVKIQGKDKYNNRAEVLFLLPVQTKWKEEAA